MAFLVTRNEPVRNLFYGITQIFTTTLRTSFYIFNHCVNFSEALSNTLHLYHIPNIMKQFKVTR